MGLRDVTEVVELSNPKEVNEYLKVGWKLLHTYTQGYDSDPPRVYHQTLIYSLGWTQKEPTEAVHPKPTSKWTLSNDLDD